MSKNNKMSKKNNEVFYNRTTVDFHTFIDLVTVFEPEHLTDNYYEYRKMLIDIYHANDRILNIVELVRNVEVDDGALLIDSYNSLSAVIFDNGTVKYVACY